MAVPYVEYQGADYQEIAENVDIAVSSLLTGIHHMNCVMRQSSDGGPVITGTIAALMAFALDGELTADTFRHKLLETYDQLAPQITMRVAAARAGAEGTA